MQLFWSNRLIVLFLVFAYIITASAQDNTPFRGTIYNSDYNVYITMNFYEKDVVIRGQEVLGAMDGYLGDNEDFRKWLFVETQLDGNSKAQIQVINNEGSEDLTVTLTYNNDGTYTLRQGSGSTMKIARQQKWMKLPKVLTFTTQKEKK